MNFLGIFQRIKFNFFSEFNSFFFFKRNLICRRDNSKGNERWGACARAATGNRPKIAVRLAPPNLAASIETKKNGNAARFFFLKKKLKTRNLKFKKKNNFHLKKKKTNWFLISKNPKNSFRLWRKFGGKCDLLDWLRRITWPKIWRLLICIEI